jgi:hypothetical protein
VEKVTGRKSDSNVPRVLKLLTRECLGASRNRMKQRDLEFAVGERVLLSTKYLRLKLLRESSKYTAKLMPRYIGPYAVEAKVGKVSYRLALDTTMKVHPVFHVSLLEPYHGDGVYQPPPLPYQLDRDTVYLVSGVLDHRFITRGRNKPQLQYLVHWEGYGSEHDSWEPETNRDAPKPKPPVVQRGGGVAVKRAAVKSTRDHAVHRRVSLAVELTRRSRRERRRQAGMPASTQ